MRFWRKLEPCPRKARERGQSQIAAAPLAGAVVVPLALMALLLPAAVGGAQYLLGSGKGVANVANRRRFGGGHQEVERDRSREKLYDRRHQIYR